MAAAEEDTELRDLLVQTLESSGVLNKIKAELRAAVFLALEEQEKVENKTPLVNESLKKFLSTKDGRVVAGLVVEFLQFFNLDFTLAVFEPESSTLNGLDSRENLARDLGIIEAEGTVGGPLLLEVIRRCHQKKVSSSAEVAPVLSDIVRSPPKSPDERSSTHTIPSKIPRYKGLRKQEKCLDKAGEQVAEASVNDTSISSGETKSKSSIHFLPNETKLDLQVHNKDLNTKEKSDPGVDEDDVEGDSFFDDPIPKPERTYGWPPDNNSDTEDDAGDLSVTKARQPSLHRKNEPNKQGRNVASLSDVPPLKSGLSSLAGAPSLKEHDNSNRNSVLKDLHLVNAKLGSLELGTGDEDDYADDFNSISHRSEKSDVSIGEDIEEISVEMEDLNASDKLEDITQDLTISQLSDGADYLEDVE
ncbi:centrosomal protein 43 isoform X1 [Alligator mississippiensis]|uniref:centrosomal protein 43 isoform X1 n=1 Tax=Alligator mississippiensis TaxID=8496 RepID=UPI0009076D96|nr:centrosomal protein 43 isoform X1 [Alligator mississippiensis]